jgi:hypothetical protein
MFGSLNSNVTSGGGGVMLGKAGQGSDIAETTPAVALTRALLLQEKEGGG